MRAVLLLALLTTGFYWKLALTRQYVWYDHPDMAYLELPRIQFIASEVHRGRFPLWDPHIWMGQPLIGQTQPGPLNPLNLLFVLLPLRDGALRPEFLNWYFVLMHFIAALGAYALCRHLRRSRAASIAGACVFSFGGFTGSAPWLDVLSGAIWIPFICLFFLRSIRGPKPLANAGLCGFMLGVSWLSGHHEVPLMISFALAIAWLLLVFRRGWRMLAPAAASFVVAGLCAAVQLWPTWEFGRLALRWGPISPRPVGWNDVVSYLSSEMYSLTPRGLAGIVLPGQGTIGDSSGYLGLTAAALALIAVWTAWRMPPVRWFATLGCVSIVYALGGFTAFHGIIYSLIPILDKARVPIRALSLTCLALALLASYGLDILLRRPGATWITSAARLAGILGAALILGSAAGILAFGDAMALAGWTALAAAGVLSAWRAGRLSRPVVLTLLLFLMLTEMYAFHTRSWQSSFSEHGQRFARAMTAHDELAAFLRREPAPNRVAVNDQDIPANFGDLYSINTTEGYTAGVTANLHRFGRHAAKGQRLYSVTHYLARQPGRPDHIDSYEGAEGVKAFRVPGALPRARAVHETATVSHLSALEPLLNSPEFDPARTVALIGSAPALERCESGRVDIATYAPNRVRIKARMGCRGMVVLSDTFYPGWRAYVDGRETPIWEAYGAVRGVVVESGQHEIEFRYRPVSVYGGAVLTAIGLMLALGCGIAVLPFRRQA